MRTTVTALGFLAILASALSAQTFSSGSTGADGALDLTAGDKTVTLPDSGILNYTTVNIPLNRTLTFKNNLQNTPVIMLAQGAVNVAGNISLRGNGRIPGPGGFYGGAPHQPGFGPGAGQPNGPNTDGTWVGPLSLVPITGRSGGAGVSNFCPNVAGGGGGGGIAIASSVSVTVAGQVDAGAGNGADVKVAD